MDSLAERMEQAMREAVEEFPEYPTSSENEWLEALVDAADGIRMASQMRLDELP